MVKLIVTVQSHEDGHQPKMKKEVKERFKELRARLVCVFKNWKLLFKNICGNTCGWKSVLKCVKCCLKTENGCLKTQTKHPLSACLVHMFKKIFSDFK